MAEQQTDSASDLLTGQAEPVYGQDHRSHTLEIYKILVEMADRVSARRQLVNSFFLALNSSLTALVGYTSLASSDPDNPEFLMLLAFVGAIGAVLWLLMIDSFNKLNDAKFKIILEVEQGLPIRPFYAERQVYRQLRRRMFTAVEAGIPALFIVIHIFVLSFAFIALVRDLA